MDFSMDEDDPILPIKISHQCEEIWDGETLEQIYNYLIYEFETAEHIYRARAYLDQIHTVAVYGPFQKSNPDAGPLHGVALDQGVLAYLRRRYQEITVLGATGYVPVTE